VFEEKNVCVTVDTNIVHIVRFTEAHLRTLPLFLFVADRIFQMSSTNSPASDIEIKYTQIFINNEWHKAANGKTFSVINPSTGEEICQVEEGTRV
jgi:hypothetical protein